MPRVIWKGAISFGLVHVPVALYPASQEIDINFDWLDKRSMDPVGYKRINKRTGKEIDKEHIARGIKQTGGDYVLLTDDEIKAAFPQSTQTIEIESFVKASEIDFVFLEKPYYLEPLGKGEKVYALLREAMLGAGVIGIARVVMHTKEHLAALIPSGPALMLNTIRWATEIRDVSELKLPPAGKAAANLKASELKMAAQLVGDMTSPWRAEDYTDTFSAAVHQLVDKKLAAGETEIVTPLESADDSASAASNVVDLTALLTRSLAKRKPVAAAKAPGKTIAGKPAAAVRKATSAKKTNPPPAARKRA
ncbi:MAG: non-homologous end joining protein Ku [Burkholderiales bacterium]